MTRILPPACDVSTGYFWRSLTTLTSGALQILLHAISPTASESCMGGRGFVFTCLCMSETQTVISSMYRQNESAPLSPELADVLNYEQTAC